MHGYLVSILVPASVLTAQASDFCMSEPKEKWISEAEMKRVIAGSGRKYSISKQTASNCDEIYGKTRDGKRNEIYFNPVDGKVVPLTVC
jgi:hypothetical protein